MNTTMHAAVATVCLTLLGATAAACGAAAQKPEAPNAVPVMVGAIRKTQTRDRIAVSGSVSTPKAPALVSFLVAGKVVSVGPREGDFVQEGTVLARIDPTDYLLALKAAEAQAASAQAALAKALHSARPEQLEQARINLERAEDEHRRMKLLHDADSLAPNDYLKFKAAFEHAAQVYEQAKAGGQKEDKDLAQAAFTQAAAQLDVAKKALADATLYAPASGYVSRRLIEPGNTAAPGHPVFEIIGIDPVEINVGIPETDVRLMKVGQKAAISVPALPGGTFEGTVRLINVSADPGTRTYMARITVPNPDHRLRIGMVAEAAILGDATVAMLTVPGTAVVRDAQGATQVYVYYPDQKRVYAKRVEIGVTTGRDVQIKSGLSGDELIVIGGQTALRDGRTVSATEQQIGGE
jgi:multidrug efflux pump subunit AcrA (membrane-fusion protein)